MALTLPDLSCEISYGTPSWGAPTYVEEKTRLRSFTFKRGKQHELQRFDAGTSRLTLHNRDRAVDPTYAAGPHAGQLLPGVRYRMRATWAGTTYPLFVHFAERWKPEWPDVTAANLVLTGVDAFKSFRKKRITSTGYRELVASLAARAWYRLGEADGSTLAADSSGNGRYGTYLGTPKLDVAGMLLTEDNTAMDTNLLTGWMKPPPAAAIAGTGAMSAVLWFKTSTNDNTFRRLMQQDQAAYQEWNLAVWNGKLEGSGPLAAAPEATTPLVSDGNWHMAALTRAVDGRTWKLYLDGVLKDTKDDGGVYSLSGQNLRVGGSFAVGAPEINATIDEVALFDAELTGTQIANLYTLGRGPWGGQTSGVRVGAVLDTIGWPAGDRIIDAGNSVMQSESRVLTATAVLDYLQKVEESESALLFIDALGRLAFRSRFAQLLPPYTSPVAVLGDGPGEVPYEGSPELWVDDTDVISEALSKRLGGFQQRAFDAASDSAYGPASLSRTDLLLTTDNETLDRANWDLAHYKTPAPRIGTIRLHPLDDPNTMWPLVLSLDIGQRVTFKVRPVPKTTAAFSQDAIVEGIEHTMTEDGDWFVDVFLGAADFTDYWVLGTSQLGVNTRLAF